MKKGINEKELDGVMYSLYWEDVSQRLLFGTVVDSPWKLAESIFGYKKHNAIYIFNNEKLTAFYGSLDSKKEAEVGFWYYSILSNVERVIQIKKKVFYKSKSITDKYSTLKITELTNEELHQSILLLIDMYCEGLSAHYLTQPQFFEKFEELNESKHDQILSSLAKARFEYSKPSWVNALNLSHRLLEVYGNRLGLNQKLVESMTIDEFKANNVRLDILNQREKTYAIVSTDHKLQIFADQSAQKYIQFYDDYIADYISKSESNSASGVVGNKGKVCSEVFVISNEYYDTKNKPLGMKKGMVLIVQNAWPELQPYFELASAIVTNEGGITSHGVVVARELGIPCIVGTRIATKIFKTGDCVEVDADRGIVRKIIK